MLTGHRIVSYLRPSDKSAELKIYFPISQPKHIPGRVAQSVACLTAGTCLTADPVVGSLHPGPVPYFRVDLS